MDMVNQCDGARATKTTTCERRVHESMCSIDSASAQMQVRANLLFGGRTRAVHRRLQLVAVLRAVRTPCFK